MAVEVPTCREENKEKEGVEGSYSGEVGVGSRRGDSCWRARRCVVRQRSSRAAAARR
jgi:hypothetical protein